MQKIQNLLQVCTRCFTKVSKKAYSTCAIITAGAAVIAVIAMDRTDFGGSGKNRTTVQAQSVQANSLEEEEENNAEVSQYSNILTMKLYNPGDIIEHSLEEFRYQVNEIDTIIPRDMSMTGIKGTENINAEATISTNEEVYILSSGFIMNEVEFEVTDKDFEALLKIVEAEATNEDLTGRILVANVVFNRARWSSFPDTVYDVIHQQYKGKYQFSPLSDGRYYTVKVTDMTRKAVELALEGIDYSEEALFFAARSMANPKSMRWFDSKLDKVLKHGAHEFFTYK